MPDNGKSSARSAKKRKTKETTDGCDSSFVSAYCNTSEELCLKQSHEHHKDNEKGLQMHKLQEAVKDPQSHRLFLKAPTEKSLKEHTESVLSEIKESREKLFQWWRQEIQTIVDEAAQRRVADADAEKKRKERDDCGASRVVASVQAVPKGGPTGGKNSQDACKLKTGKQRITSDTSKEYAHDSNNVSEKSSELSADCKPVIVDVAVENKLPARREIANEPDQGNASGRSELKVEIPAHNMLTAESKSPIFDMCLGAELGGNSKDVEGLDGTLESGVTMREGFEFNKANHDIQKGLDGLERLRETRSALFDMGFDDEESNEGNGVGCSLESAASSKINAGLSKASIGVSNGFNKGFDAGFAAGFEGQGRDQLGSNGVPEGAATNSDDYGSIKVKKEVLSAEGNHAAVKNGLVNSIRGGWLDNATRQVDCMMGAKLGHALLKGGRIGGGSLAEVSQPRDVQQQVGMGGCGIKRSFVTGMTFKGSALECKNDVFQQADTSFADVFNSATSSILVVKDSVQLPAGVKGRLDSSALPTETHITGTASPSWSMFAASKNAINQTLQESKAHLEYASRSKLGDAIVGSGRTVDFPGFDTVPGYASHIKAGTEILDAYQHEQANTSSMYFSSLCTNNSVYLPTSNRMMNVQPSIGSVSRPMLMGMPGQFGGHHDRGHRDPSNMHTFLGLGMNGVPAVANNIQVFSGLYSQNNQQHNQASYKNTSQSTSPMVSHQGNSAVHKKAILELNF
ncbi:hypothetical protein L7F22_057690 [Adiantum nelumboides]|nr:hypothetical protein [Adiantum nelumboides]